MTTFVRQLAPRLSACLGLLVAAACGLLLLRSLDVSTFEPPSPAVAPDDVTGQRHPREDRFWQSMGGVLADTDSEPDDQLLAVGLAHLPGNDTAEEDELEDFEAPLLPRSTATAAEKEKLLSGVDRDLAPFKDSGITLEMVEQVYCTYNVQSFRVQIINGEWFIAGETHNFLTIHLKTKQVLADFAARYQGRLPDVDFIVQTSDWLPPAFNGSHPDCPLQGPVFTANKEKSSSHGILFPDESWVDWARLRYLISTAAQKLPWESRQSKLLFRGGPTGQRPDLLGGPWEELQNDELDIKLTEWYEQDNKGSYLSMPEQCDTRYLLYMEGNTWASRLKQLLLCNSTVVVNASPYVGFWWHMLEHGKHVHVIPRLTDNESTPRKLKEVVRRLKMDGARSQHIARNGYRLAMEVLHPDNAFLYWHRLITRYAALQRFNVTRHPDAIPLERSVLQQQDNLQINFRQRTCNVCIPRPDRDDRAAAYTSKLFEIDGHA